MLIHGMLAYPLAGPGVLVGMTLSLMLSAAFNSLPWEASPSLFALGGGGTSTTRAESGRVVALTTHKGTYIRTKIGVPLATTSPGSRL